MRRTLRTRIAALALSGFLLPLALPSAASAGDPKVIRIGYPGTGTGGRPFAGGTFTAYAHASGLLEQEFRKEGIKVEWTFFKLAGPAINEAYANKLLDMSLLGDQAAIVGKAGGLKTKVVLATGVRGFVQVVVPSDSPIRTIQDLRGKRVALFRGTALQLAGNRVLEAHGLGEKDVKSVNMDPLASQAALASKDIDALFTIGYQAITLEDQGVGRIIYSSKGDERITGFASSLLVTEDFEARYPHIVQRVVNSLVKAAQWTADDRNREALLQSWAKSGTSYSAFKRDLAGQDLKASQNPIIDDFYVATLKKAVADSRRFKFIRKDVDVDAWVDRRYQENALRELGLGEYWTRYAANGKPGT